MWEKKCGPRSYCNEPRAATSPLAAIRVPVQFVRHDPQDFGNDCAALVRREAEGGPAEKEVRDVDTLLLGHGSPDRSFEVRSGVNRRRQSLPGGGTSRLLAQILLDRVYGLFRNGAIAGDLAAKDRHEPRRGGDPVGPGHFRSVPFLKDERAHAGVGPVDPRRLQGGKVGRRGIDQVADVFGCRRSTRRIAIEVRVRRSDPGVPKPGNDEKQPSVYRRDEGVRLLHHRVACEVNAFGGANAVPSLFSMRPATLSNHGPDEFLQSAPDLGGFAGERIASQHACYPGALTDGFRHLRIVQADSALPASIEYVVDGQAFRRVHLCVGEGRRPAEAVGPEGRVPIAWPRRAKAFYGRAASGRN